MRLALLIGVSPKRHSHGPIVRVQPGWWRFHVEGHKDSRIHVKPHQQEIVHGETIVLETVHDIQAHFEHRGTEDNINVYLDSV
jgi:hypothetical protein